ncbi:hypothetical protein [Nocardioides sp. SYSU D00038]|nr:hypothetical protein [Nocardioides sp. SYSU D00038]
MHANALTDLEARTRIAERRARSAAPRPQPVPRRHRMATALRRVADRLDG